MVRHLCAASAAISLSLLFGVSMLPEKTSTLDTRSSRSSGADTLRKSVSAGTPLIVALPDAADASYSIERAPALSWLIRRSFMWRTTPEDTGRHEVVVRRDVGEARDTLFLLITVE